MTDYGVLQRAQERRKKAVDQLWKATTSRAERKLEFRIYRIDAQIRKLIKRQKR